MRKTIGVILKIILGLFIATVMGLIGLIMIGIFTTNEQTEKREYLYVEHSKKIEDIDYEDFNYIKEAFSDINSKRILVSTRRNKEGTILSILLKKDLWYKHKFISSEEGVVLENYGFYKDGTKKAIELENEEEFLTKYNINNEKYKEVIKVMDMYFINSVEKFTYPSGDIYIFTAMYDEYDDFSTDDYTYIYTEQHQEDMPHAWHFNLTPLENNWYEASMKLADDEEESVLKENYEEKWGIELKEYEDKNFLQ